MLTTVGLLTIVAVVALLISNRVSPLVILTLVPLTAALLAGYDFDEISEFFESGIGSVMSVAIMFVFAILYFGIMRDVGLFEPLVRFIVRVSRGNVVAVAVGTVCLGAVAHLDGSGATTLLVTIPPLLPVYKRLGMSPYLLLTLAVTSVGVMNLLPWAGPIGRAGAVTGIDPTELYRPLIPVQIAGLVLLIAMAVVMGMREKRRIAKRQEAQKLAAVGGDSADQSAQSRGSAAITDEEDEAESPEEQQRRLELMRPKLIWVNAALTVAIIAVLMVGWLPTPYVFMVGVCLALLINYRKMQEQLDRIKDHAANALSMAVIILAAGSFLGILGESGMLDSIAEDIIQVAPEPVLQNMHIVLGIIALPLDFVLSTDAFWFGFFPVVEQVTASVGISTTTAVYAAGIGNIVGALISPFAPALWLGLGLARLEIGKFIRYAFLWMWGYSLLLFLAAILLGVVEV
ncbi:CitMHS family transporter [Nesterenkonia alkaliphila]|uniref:Citrate transporter n=1 Tax=Nesterenkonia alkaliphila TaxID=1463631 RepID=A0A7K1UHM1_9MICC|nr:citrate:proton symporter [Nesterenkonia alkaliphila]MVT25965.1 citrate transporter [Nesterenkonia alkaliphila]GFZ95662.1 citrate transporter [Nesterenkonia alkaliphila]